MLLLKTNFLNATTIPRMLSIRERFFRASWVKKNCNLNLYTVQLYNNFQKFHFYQL